MTKNQHQIILKTIHQHYMRQYLRNLKDLKHLKFYNFHMTMAFDCLNINRYIDNLWLLYLGFELARRLCCYCCFHLDSCPISPICAVTVICQALHRIWHWFCLEGEEQRLKLRFYNILFVPSLSILKVLISVDS